MGSKSPRHHEIPRFYLEGFCNPGESFLWRFTRAQDFAPGANKSRSNPYRSGLKETALRKDGYAVRIPGKSVDYSYELRLQQEERKANQVLSKIRNREPLNVNDKLPLAHYITLMQKRLEYRDQQFRGAVEELVRTFDWDNLQKTLAFYGRFDLALQVPQAQEHFRSNAGITRLLRESMMHPYIDALRELLRMTWTFEVAEEGTYFLTSDNPVIYDEVRGLRESILIFPVTKRVTLIAHRGGEPDMLSRMLPAEMVRQLNTIIVQSARTEVYSSQAEEWIYTTLIKSGTGS